MTEKKRISDAQRRATENYLKTLEEIKVRVPKGEKDKIKAYAEQQCESVNSFINRIIGAAMERNKTSVQTGLQQIETTQDGDLVLSVLGYNALDNRNIYIEKHTGKQYYIEAIEDDTPAEEYDEDDLPW